MARVIKATQGLGLSMPEAGTALLCINLIIGAGPPLAVEQGSRRSDWSR